MIRNPRLLIRPHVMAGVRDWFDRHVGDVAVLGRYDAAEGEQPIGWWLPDARVLADQPADPFLRHYAMPMRAVRVTP
jgi:hypothetical protein